MAARFEGKVALVTGAGSGMGLAAATMLAREGATVVFTDIDEAAAQAGAAAAGANALRLYVARYAEVDAVVSQVASEHGRIDLLFNNAGHLGAHGTLSNVTEADYDRIFDVNVKGAFMVLGRVLREMIARSTKGAIVNTASIAGIRTSPNVALYSVSKFAVIGMTRNAAHEAGPHGIRVNAIAPGPAQTSFANMSEASIGNATAVTPLGRLGTAEDMARAALWLLSDDAAFVHGAILPVDGGQVA